MPAEGQPAEGQPAEGQPEEEQPQQSTGDREARPKLEPVPEASEPQSHGPSQAPRSQVPVKAAPRAAPEAPSWATPQAQASPQGPSQWESWASRGSDGKGSDGKGKGSDGKGRGSDGKGFDRRRSEFNDYGRCYESRQSAGDSRQGRAGSSSDDRWSGHGWHQPPENDRQWSNKGWDSDVPSAVSEAEHIFRYLHEDYQDDRPACQAPTLKSLLHALL